MGGGVRRRSGVSAITHSCEASSSRAGDAGVADTGRVPSRMGRAAEPRQEIAVNHFFAEIASRCDHIRSYDDIASGVAGIAFCICCAAIFSAIFVGAI